MWSWAAALAHPQHGCRRRPRAAEGRREPCRPLACRPLVRHGPAGPCQLVTTRQLVRTWFEGGARGSAATQAGRTPWAPLSARAGRGRRAPAEWGAGRLLPHEQRHGRVQVLVVEIGVVELCALREPAELVVHSELRGAAGLEALLLVLVGAHLD